MPVNFGLLGDIKPPQVIATLPSARAAANPVDEFANGLLSGALKGSQLATDSVNRSKMQQQMEQDKQLFPSQLRNSEAVARNNEATAMKAEDALEYARKLDEAAAQGEEQWLKALKPDERYTNLEKKATMNKAIAEAKKSGIDAAYSVATYFGASHSAAMQYEDPAQQQQVYTQMRNQAPDDVKATMPEQFDSKFAPIAISAGMQAESHMLKQKFGSGTSTQTDTKKRLGEINEARKAAGQAPLAPEEEAKILQQGLETSISPNKGQPDPVTTNLATLDKKDLENAQSAAQEAEDSIDTIKSFRALNKQFSTGFASATKLQVKQGIEALTGKKLEGTAYGEALQSNAMDFVMKRISQTKGAISEREMEAFSKASPGMRNSQAGNEIILNVLEATERRKVEKAEMQREYYEKNRNLKGFKNEWDKYVNENPILDPKTLKITNPKYMSQDAGSTRSNTASTNNTNSFEEGKIYKDSNGNKARYMNGKWESM